MKKLVLILVLLLIGSFTIYSKNIFFKIEGLENEWETRSPMPTKRTEHVAIEVSGEIYVIGGFDISGRILKKVELYNIESDSWRTVSPLPIPLHHTSITTYDNKIYVIGGYTDNWMPSGRVYVYDANTDSWSRKSNMPTARGALISQRIGGYIFSVGGVSSIGVTGLNEVYNILEDKWETKAPMPTPREHLASGVINNTLYIIGGRQRSLSSNMNTNEAYSAIEDKWFKKSPMPSKRGGITASSIGDSIFVFGGETNTKTFDNNEQYISTNDTWIKRKNMPTSRHGLAAITYNNSIFVIGGGREPGFSMSGVNEIFTPREFQVIIKKIVFNQSNIKNNQSVEAIPEPNIKNNQSVEAIPENKKINNVSKNLDRSHNPSEFRSREISNTINGERYFNFIYASLIIIAIIIIIQIKKFLNK